MEFKKMLNDYIYEQGSKALKSFMKVIDTGVLDDSSPIETLYSVIITANDILKEQFEENIDDYSFEKDLKDLKDEIKPIIAKVFEKFYKDNQQPYMRLGMLLITIGINYMMPEYYVDDLVTQMLDKKEFTEEHLKEIANNYLLISPYTALRVAKEFDYDISDTLKDCDEAENKNTLDSVIESIKSGTYDIKDIFVKLENNEINVIDIMMNVSSDEYDKIMNELSEYNRSKKTSETSKEVKIDIADIIPAKLKDAIRNTLNDTDITDRIVEGIAATAVERLKTAPKLVKGEGNIRLQIINDDISVNEIVKKIQNGLINPYWVVDYLKEHDRINDLKILLKETIISSL